MRDLLKDDERAKDMLLSHKDQIFIDITHTKIDEDGWEMLKEVAVEMRLFDKIAAMKAGEKINGTEKRQVQHYKLRT